MPPSGKSHSSHSSSHHSSHSHSSHRSSSSRSRHYGSYGGYGYGAAGTGRGGGCSPRGCGCVSLLALPIVVIFLGTSFFFAKNGGQENKLTELFNYFSNQATSSTQRDNDRETRSNATVSHEDEIYVEEIGRYCPWDPEEEWYYDSATECYFWYNNEIDTPQWQYWYEGISSDYGDYGWMEYDEDEKEWYIQWGADDWEVLPDTYDTGSLWHIED